jgi:4-amino-4-deoxy-L-arabinose transferase-like glycosyltransferase
MKLQRIIFSLCFLILILVSFGIKLIEFDNTYSGFHLVRQMDNLVAIESYFIEGIELKRRTTSGISVVFEFPVYYTLAALLSSSQADILTVSRFINLVFALLSMILLFRIATIWFDSKTAIYSTLFFAFAPLNLMYHRSVMMDISSVFFCLAATWLLLEYLNNGEKLWHIPLFIFAGGLSVVTKALYFFPVGAIALANFITQYQPPFSTNATDYLKKQLRLVISFVLIAAIMLGWMLLVKSANETGKGVLLLLSNWDFLIAPKYYALLVFRFILLILNPFTLFLFVIGIALIWTHHRGKDVIALPFAIPMYFIIFGQSNYPHEYYSLIMIPYCSLVAGLGAVWLEGILINNNLILRRGLIFGIFGVFSSVVSVLIFFLNFLIGSPNLDQKPVQIEQEMKLVLEPWQTAQVYINKANFPLTDYIKYNRSLYLLYALNVRSEEDIRVYGQPITEKEILYALRQFGGITHTLNDIPKVNINHLQDEHAGKIRYAMFYRYSEKQKSQIKDNISRHQIFYESADWLVYDLAKGVE